MFGFVRGRAVAVIVAVTALLGGVTAGSVAAATKTTVTWGMSSLTAGQVKSLSDVASSNSPGVKTWSKTGSCTLTPKSKPTKLTMGTGGSCTLKLKIAKSGKYPAKTRSKTIILALYGVGDTGPAGGTIFYVDLTRPEGSQYFEAACAGWYDGTCGGNDLTTLSWLDQRLYCAGYMGNGKVYDGTCDGNDLTDPDLSWGEAPLAISGADGTAIGDGEQNTTDIMGIPCNQLVSMEPCPNARAARLPYALVLSGQDDWFLPSQDELNQMYIQQKVIGGFLQQPYWSSSEVDGGYFARMQPFYNGSQQIFLRGQSLYVRPVRSF